MQSYLFFFDNMLFYFHHKKITQLKTEPYQPNDNVENSQLIMVLNKALHDLLINTS